MRGSGPYNNFKLGAAHDLLRRLKNHKEKDIGKVIYDIHMGLNQLLARMIAIIGLCKKTT